jgi:uncharacterized repeat protein (TIGR04042 family)
MPEVHFRVRWPDGSLERCYSPSRTIKEYLRAGASYPLADFVARCRAALERGSERVRQKYGQGCGQAAAQIADIERTAGRFDAHDAAARVTVEALEE